MKFKVSQYARLHNVTTRTVWNWYYRGIIKCERDSTNHLWVIEEDPNHGKELSYAVYARVSSSENKSNLDLQAQRLIDFCNARGNKVVKVVKEVGSGLNDNRPKLEALLKDKSINVIVVEHKDRLTRFGFNYIETLLKAQDRSIEVVNQVDGDIEDFTQDFVSVITSFCARIYGKRRSKRNTEKLIEELKNTKEDAVS